MVSATYNRTIRSLFGRPRVVQAEPGACLGLEIECEGWNLPTHMLSYWGTHGDGSLRPPTTSKNGIPGAFEYTFTNPLSYQDTVKALRYLNNTIASSTGKLRESNRTSIHVHVDFYDDIMRHVYNTIVLYMVFEDALVRYCGPEREGNLFCLRFSDAEFMVQMLRDCLRKDRYSNFDNQEYRYGGLNFNALYKFGSLEFRTMRGAVDGNGLVDLPVVIPWVEMLLSLKEKAMEFNDPQQILQQVSLRRPERFVYDIFGDNAKYLLRNYKDVHEFETKVYSGVRLAQDIAYAVEWVTEAPEEKPVLKKRKRTPEEVINSISLEATAADNFWNNVPMPSWATPVLTTLASNPGNHTFYVNPNSQSSDDGE